MRFIIWMKWLRVRKLKHENKDLQSETGLRSSLRILSSGRKKTSPLSMNILSPTATHPIFSGLNIVFASNYLDLSWGLSTNVFAFWPIIYSPQRVFPHQLHPFLLTLPVSGEKSVSVYLSSVNDSLIANRSHLWLNHLKGLNWRIKRVPLFSPRLFMCYKSEINRQINKTKIQNE